MAAPRAHVRPQCRGRSSEGHPLASSTVAEAEGEGGHLLEDGTALLHETGDLVDGVDDGGVVAPTELTADGGVAEVGHLAEHVHADLAGVDQWPAPALADEVVDADPEHVGRGIEDHAGGEEA